MRFSMNRNQKFIAAILIFTSVFLHVEFCSAQISRLELPLLDVEKLQAEDLQRRNDIRCAAPSAVSLKLEKGELKENGNTIAKFSKGSAVHWDFKITGSNALGLTLLLRNFHLPKGCTLSVRNADSTAMMVYSEKDNNSNNILTIGMITGSTAILSYQQPENCTSNGQFEIFSIYQAYKKNHELTENQKLAFGFGTALGCNININCPGTDSVKNIKRGISRVMMVLKEGIGYCTGNLLNNTIRDGKPLILTAFHCQDGYTPMYDFWKFDFNYEAPTCSNPLKEPKVNRMTGCIKRAGWRNTDFLLLELNAIIPDSFNVYYNGWDRSFSTPVGRTYFVHHPSGDIKKFSVDENASTSVYNFPIQWNNNVTTPATFHFRMAPSKGTFEVGSSGCGLYNAKKHFVGNFNGGDLNGCTVSNGFFGRMAISWTGGGNDTSSLKKWLDPKNLGVLTLDGIERPAKKLFNIESHTPANKPLPCSVLITTTSAEGLAIRDSLYLGTGKITYEFPPYFVKISIKPVLDLAPREGLSTADIVLIQKHILNVTQLTEPWKLIAADANNNGSISVADVVDIRKLILSVIPKLPKSSAWRFVLKNAVPQPLFNEQTAIFELGLSPGTVEFTGIKIGDVNRGY